MMPMRAAKKTMRTVQKMATTADFFISFWERSDMKRTMMCGMPK